MNADYLLKDSSQVFSPSLLFYKTLLARNIANLVKRVGDPARLRPHVKTHKTRQIVKMEQAAGITKQKCATIAEAEMLGQCEVPDILLSYPMVGPNCTRFAQLVKKYPASKFSCLEDHALGIQQLSAALTKASVQAEVLLDIDVGQHRTGIAPGAAAQKLYEMIARSPGLKPGGLHVYDGHNHQHPPEERKAAVEKMLGPVLELRDGLTKAGLPVPRMVCGGTPTFPVFASMDLAGVECSPGTCVLNDVNYGTWFQDLNEFTPAALLLTRVISRPTPTRVTFDLGYKAVASDPPAGKRCVLLDVQGEQVLQNEEHLVVETPDAEKYKPGDVAYAMPAHVCPTCALHQFAYVVENGQVVDKWEIASRDRVLTV
ncbi:MAG: D-TA family PLP-dependent enzyme [Planctomycetes bacterium]|nr:D-TA family PLP-dependent enzyme [Planctomycetota bacterium]